MCSLHMSELVLLQYVFVFGDICYIQVVGVVFLGLDLSALSSQQAVLVSAQAVFIKLQLQTTGTCAV